MLKVKHRALAAAVASCAAPFIAVGISASGAEQNRDLDATKALLDGSREVVRTASTQADRFETDHVIVYIDKDLLPPEAERMFASDLERQFVATSEYLKRRFDRASRSTRSPVREG